MEHNIYSTFDPEVLFNNRYKLLFDYLKSKGQSIEIANSINSFSDLENMIMSFMEKASSYNFIFHIPEYINSFLFHEKSQNSFLENDFNFSVLEIQENLNETLKDFAKPGTIFDADIFISREEELLTLYNQLSIPFIQKKSIKEFEQNLYFPIVLKKNRTSKYKGIFFIENEKQYRKLFDAKDSKSNNLFRKEDFKASDFIKTPSEYYTYYKVFTTGNGNIFAAGMSYSDFKKQDQVFVMDNNSIVNNPESPYFLKQKRIKKRDHTNIFQIPLNPDEYSRDITSLEKEILAQHGIKNQELPKPIYENSKKLAKLLGENGIYVLSQDWIQNTENDFCCMEINKFPSFGALQYQKAYFEKHNITLDQYATKLIGDNIIKQLGD